MNWSNNDEVSEYLEVLSNKHLSKPTYLPIEVDKSIIQILDKVGYSPTIILDDVSEGTNLTEANYQVETSTIIFFVLQDTKPGDAINYNPILESCKKIAKDIIARILVENEDNEEMQVQSSKIEDVKEVKGSLYGSMVELVIRGNLLEYDESVWE